MGHALKELIIDETWSVMYAPTDNDRPYFWKRQGGFHSTYEENNAVTAMFYTLLKVQKDTDLDND